MRTKAFGRVKGLQYDTSGKLIGTVIHTAFGQSVFLPEPNILLIQHEHTKRLGLWDCDKRQIVELGKHERVSEEQA